MGTLARAATRPLSRTLPRPLYGFGGGEFSIAGAGALAASVAAASGAGLVETIYTAQGINMNSGSAAELSNAAPSGFVNSQFGSMFTWVRLESYGASGISIFTETQAGTDRNWVRIEANGTVTLRLRNVIGGTLTYSGTAVSSVPLNTWVPLFVSWDTRHTGDTYIQIDCYVGDVQAIPTPATFNATDAILHVGNAIVIGDGIANTTQFTSNGALADFWYDPTTYIDFGLQANRRKFTDDNGRAISLGTTGELPTGVAPKIYLRGDSATWGANASGGSALTVTNSLTNAATNPDTATTFAPIGTAIRTSSGKKLTRSAALTGGAANTLQFTFSIWFKYFGASANGRYFIDMRPSGTFGVNLFLNIGNAFGFAFMEVASSGQISGVTNANPLANNGLWHHLLVSGTFGTGLTPLPGTTLKVYGDNLNMSPTPAHTGSAFTGCGFDATSMSLFAANGSPGTFDGEVAEVFLATGPGTYIDIAVEANRLKFINADGTPANLGTNGSTPLGITPLIYLRGPEFGFGKNAAGNGDFSPAVYVGRGQSSPDI